jgi:hypothetical protein
MSQDNINEVIVEGLTPEDFILISEIIEKYPLNIVNFNEINNINSLYQKISQIISYISEDKVNDVR